ncbi:MAG: hypothetical protein A4E65_00247 [Syntrophorhabdus sp. PtaU1.Bin153]|nr:MAG: hypothetical protein A4E65_00247 [Syntrophorhabdus sp. PtaU1.Bin153]
MNDAYNPEALIHDPANFARAGLEKRLRKHNFASSNLPRVEMFLWDLELFLHLQEIFKERIVLKGGAAVQLYLPVNIQRTSTDIDMICAVSDDELSHALAAIEKKFEGRDGLLKFQRHIPIRPRTNLPSLRTFFIDAPSVCTDRELHMRNGGVQRQQLKVEFFMTEEPVEANRVRPQEVFALERGEQTYHVLPINPLLGDKLATLAPNTVGIPLGRSKEYFKQVYDVDALFRSQWSRIDIDEMKKHFLSNARSESKLRQIDFDHEEIIEDIRKQMQLLASVDIKDTGNLIKSINDFQSLYLRENARKNKFDWAIAGARISFLIDCIHGSENNKLLGLLDKTDTLLRFDFVQGAEKTSYQRQFNSEFLKEFNQYSKSLEPILKSKHPQRTFWAVVSPSRLEEIASWTRNQIRFQDLIDAIGSCNPGRVAGILNLIKHNNELEPFMELRGSELVKEVKAKESQEQDKIRKQNYVTIIGYFHAAITGAEIGVDINGFRSLPSSSDTAHATKEGDKSNQSIAEKPTPWDKFK